MIASSHLAVGAAGGIFLQSRISLRHDMKSRLAIAFSTGVVTHLLLDMFPHQEYFNEWPWFLLILEVVAVSLFLFTPYVGSFANLIIFFGMSGAAFPDLLDLMPGHIFWLMHRALHATHAILPFGFNIPIFAQLTVTAIAVLYVRGKTAYPMEDL